MMTFFFNTRIYWPDFYEYLAFSLIGPSSYSLRALYGLQCTILFFFRKSLKGNAAITRSWLSVFVIHNLQAALRSVFKQSFR